MVGLPLRRIQALVPRFRQLSRDSCGYFGPAPSRSGPNAAPASVLFTDPTLRFADQVFHLHREAVRDLVWQYDFPGSHNEQEHARSGLPDQRPVLFLGYPGSLARTQAAPRETRYRREPDAPGDDSMAFEFVQQRHVEALPRARLSRHQ